jgi:hypothetical protein
VDSYTRLEPGEQAQAHETLREGRERRREIQQMWATADPEGRAELEHDPRWVEQRLAERRLAIRATAVIYRARRIGLPRARRACVGGRRRPGHRSNPEQANAPPAGEDPEPEERVVAPLLRRSTRLQIESLVRRADLIGGRR